MKRQTLFEHLQKTFAVCGAVLMVLFASCSNFDTDDDSPKASVEPGKTVAVKIVADEAVATRTAFPTGVVRDDMASFTLSVDGVAQKTWNEDKTNALTAYKVMSDSFVTITAGKHSFVLTGTEKGGAIYRGTLADVEVTDGTVLNFTLYFADVAAKGTGNLKLKPYWPEGKALALKASIYKTENKYTFDAETPVASVTWKQTNCNSEIIDGIKYIYPTSSNSYALESGYYIVLYEFFSDANATLPIGTTSELAYVTANLTSTSKVVMNALNKAYTITYEKNGGTLTSSVGQYTMLQDIVLPTAENVTKSGLDFGGWYTTEDLAEDSLITGWNKKSMSGNITVYAKWTYTVTFAANDSEETAATGETASVTSLEGTAIKLTKNGFAREGYIFNGWNTKADGSGTAYEDGYTPFKASANTMLYAQWLARSGESKAVTFIVNGGSAVAIQQVESGKTIASSPETTRTGYDFDGWYTSADGGATLGSKFAFGDDGTAVTADITLYAKWKAQEYSITYKEWNGKAGGAELTGTASGTMPEKHIYDTETPLVALEKADYGFDGWYTSSDGGVTLAAEPLETLGEQDYTADITLYAKWIRTNLFVSAAGSDAVYVDDATAYGDGSQDNPFATVSKAVTSVIKTANSRLDYTITISGEITGGMNIESTVNAKSILLQGTSNDTDILKPYGTSCAITIDSATDVTLKNIKITNGYAYTSDGLGAGITMKNKDATLTLETGALITGNNNNYSTGNAVSGGGAIRVSAGALVMNEGSVITANYSYFRAGGVYLSDDTSFTMNGGTISGNYIQKDYSSCAYGGGGVYIKKATFTMNGGTISGNCTMYSNTSGSSSYGGGGVLLNGGTFTMNGGTITANKAYRNGNGVYVLSGTFTMKDGTISDNIPYSGSYSTGGGVYSTGTFIMEGGTISGNESYNEGGGVHIYQGTFTMTGGAITGNKSTNGGGGGIFVSYGTATIADSTISKNTAGNYGGGINNNGTLTMTGCTISDNTSPSYAGGVYNSGYLTMSDSTISGNIGSYGGGVYVGAKTFTINNCTITKNESKNQGGGVYINSSSTFTMNGGIISENTASSVGGGVCISGGKFLMSGNASIPAGEDGKHDVFLYYPSCGITVADALTATAPVAKLTLNGYEYGWPVIIPGEGVELTQSVIDLFDCSLPSPWFIAVDGKLAGPTYKIIYRDKGDNEFSGTMPEDVPNSHTYGIATTLPVPTKEGCEFLGWYTDKDCFDTKKLETLSEYDYTDEIMLYAWWLPAVATIEINAGDITVTKTENADDGTVTLTAADGYSDYLWLIGSKNADSVIANSGVSADDKTFTFNKGDLVVGKAYVITVSALKNGIEFTSSVSVKRTK